MDAKPKAYSYVRMSTELQLQGDSLRRQVELSRRYAEENCLELDEELKLHDIGVSAFQGANVKRGELGAFLAAVNSGKVASGSILLIESFDRLSRAPIQSSISLMMQLLNAGITIVTLNDGRKFIPNITTFEDLIYGIIVLSRAHEESAQKSKRLKAAWENKRKNILIKPLTKRCPYWLDYDTASKSFKMNEKKARIIKRIFDDCIAGMGADSIARRLNKENISAFKSKNGWHKSSVQKILGNPEVTGRFTPKKREQNKRVEAGEPIDSYFPRIIEDNIFEAAQGAIARRSIGGGGRKGELLSNLFSKTAFCGYCGGKMVYCNRGKRGGTYLSCSNAKRGMPCESINWNYKDFETSFLSFVTELDLSQVNSSSNSELSGVRNEIMSIDGKIHEIIKKREIILQLIMESQNPDASLRNKYHLLDQEAISLEEERISLISKEKRLIYDETKRTNPSFLANLIKNLQSKDTEDAFRIRSLICANISYLVKKIDIYSSGPFRIKKANENRHQVTFIEGFQPSMDNAPFEIDLKTEGRRYRA